MKMIVSGGGTGGHIYPALSLVEALKAQDPASEVLYVGSERGLEKNIVPEKGIKFEALKIQGFKRKLFSLYNFETVYLFLKSVKHAKKIIKQFNPDVVVGTGGYVSGAVLYAAAKMGIPTVIHEQNSVVGWTNKFLSRYVDKIGIAFEDAKAQFPENKVVFTGNPRAQQVAKIKSDFNWNQIGLKSDEPTVLIFGGSQGALKINSVTAKAIPIFNQKNYQVVFVTGKSRYDDVMKNLKDVKINSNVKILPYIANMPEVLPRVSLIVGRAGATSLAEITALGIPSILIPSPYVTADHQTKNAMSLVKNHAAIIETESDLNEQSLTKKVDTLMHNEQLRQEMAENAKKMGVVDATDKLLSVCKTAINEHKN
ncbi:undecaprenyldiphospho-muramoylpentapeptide beta-N-acetylglucosaminyltransferase [Fructilactobacillus lindneri]|uniref:UDP-N-acetylglucosamine--N-acetylmuramyl-(pentapeptide) pyrophosphoryl-undecaprenol N-acetylglucosamine transferase n=2 Tax=Fructilactobacillus lindneri TaxID=53444 RepID=A0A0R2JW02_9LACO|nr:undecaprenyldiphospho-muramoylpentapeptide beta-N-acetylglucosaminyltransferase [Fructilactobacillus lindneri]ANZ58008.1 UDP-N-acetylglucosamine--N-acetylmuramyl-(pentapeptide) pyrophosphoryl-undecaprenol N-acetylglucosamine transferase [Fructilactobacillus lindneri]ANZ59278.1 UDP-N-acetylglucosamine--N-acetylmuramyl-(pentapeptide) pyrophosphoryl-undecaprenol N-acetylglucosamine transferase [Fructilactobacillus lindneri]KRN78365.1 UDP-N-acetylglucosamine LPS N-acetylglucosamine transferase [F